MSVFQLIDLAKWSAPFRAEQTNASRHTVADAPDIPAPPPSFPIFPPPLPFQIIKAYLQYSMYSYLAGYRGVWFKYEVKAMEQITNLPLKGEGIKIVAHVADRLSYFKLMMGHLDLAIALGKDWMAK